MLEKVTYVIQRVWTYLSRFPFRSRGSLFLMHSIIRALIPREDMVMERRRLAPSGNYILYGSSAFAPVRVRPWLLAGRMRLWANQEAPLRKVYSILRFPDRSWRS